MIVKVRQCFATTVVKIFFNFFHYALDLELSEDNRSGLLANKTSSK